MVGVVDVFILDRLNRSVDARLGFLFDDTLRRHRANRWFLGSGHQTWVRLGDGDRGVIRGCGHAVGGAHSAFEQATEISA